MIHQSFLHQIEYFLAAATILYYQSNTVPHREHVANVTDRFIAWVAKSDSARCIQHDDNNAVLGRTGTSSGTKSLEYNQTKEYTY